SCFFFSSRRRHTRLSRDWSSDVCSSDLQPAYQRDDALAGFWAEDRHRLADPRCVELLTLDHDLARDRDPDRTADIANRREQPRRSEERRVGKERGSPCTAHQCKKRDNKT